MINFGAYLDMHQSYFQVRIVGRVRGANAALAARAQQTVMRS